MTNSPRVLGNRYEVGELLGRGGMAEVHIGRDDRLGRTVAIKLLRSDLARDHVFQARFRREAQSAAALNHPAIVSVYDTGEEQSIESGGAPVSLPYIVMEYVQGQTLRDRLTQVGHLQVDEALDIMTGVLAALEYSHRIGIVHRDIKPANVMLTQVGDVKVMDFGIARAMDSADSTMTQTQAVIGTAQYLSPEQARGEQVDARSDLYSAGCLLYELLTGRPPFVADSPVAVAYQHVREQPIPPSQVVAGIPESVDRIVMHSLAKGRDERYQSAMEFRADVEAARAGRQVNASVPTMANATTQYVPPIDATGTRAMGPVTGAGPLLGQTGQYDPYSQQGGDPNDPYGRRAQREPQRSNRGLILGVLAVVIVLAVVGYFVAKQISSNNNGGTTASATVPGVVNQPYDIAVKTLNTAGFAKVSKEEATSDTVDEGQVIKQAPGENEKVPTTTEIVLTVSTGSGTIEVPDVKGKTQEDARQEIADAGLTAGSTEVEQNTNVDPNRVTRTSPAIGDKVKKGDTIKIYLSSPTVAMPNVIDKTEAAAKSQLKKLGLSVDVQSETSADADPGTVIRTDPTAKTQVNRDSTVTIYIAEAPETTPTTPPATSTPTPTPTITIPGLGN